jgi:hypothetical protein
MVALFFIAYSSTPNKNPSGQDALMRWINNGFVRVLKPSDKIDMANYGIAKCKIESENGETYYVASEFVTNINLS